MKRFLFGLAILLTAGNLYAQNPTITGIRLDIYRVSDQNTSLTSQSYQMAVITCGQTPAPANAVTINPTTLEWTDPNDSTKVCKTNVSTFVNALVAGDYVGKISYIYSDGVIGGASSASNPFTRFLYAIPSGPRFVR